MAHASFTLNRLMTEGHKTPDSSTDNGSYADTSKVGALIGENSRLNSENQRLAAENERLALEVQRLASTRGTSASTSVHGVSIGNADYCEFLAIPPERMHDFDHDLKELVRWMYGSKPYPQRYHHDSEGHEFNNRVEYGLVRRLRSMLLKYGVHYGAFDDEACINDERFIDKSLSDAERLVGLASHWRGEIDYYKMLNRYRVYMAVTTVLGLVKWRNICS
ncbi:hypothetical protein BDZ91DRAFT_70541 [Kalaharituber pfeilii]|nr:hypothetical protein BDZ91DRAFT_70541 [Kalaharituber pfeilii]